MSKFYFNQKLESESVIKGDLKGLAYSGAIIPYYQGYNNFIVDLSSTTVAKKKTPIFRDHSPSLVVGNGVITLNAENVLIEGKISKKTAQGLEVIGLSEDGLEWEMSLGVFDGVVEEVINETINGILVEHGWALRKGIIREVSVVALGADLNTVAQVFSQDKGDIMFTKEQWAKFACACGGSKDTTPEELQKKFEEVVEEGSSDKAKIEALEEQIETLKNEILEKQEEINKIKAEEEEEERVEEIEAELKAKNATFSAEKIKEAAKTKEATEMLLSLIKEMPVQGKKIAKEFSKHIDLGKEEVEPTSNALLSKSKEIIKEGKTTDKLEAILMAAKGVK